MDKDSQCAKLEMAKKGLHNLIVAVRGGGDLRPAMAEAEAVLADVSKAPDLAPAAEEAPAEKAAE